MVHEIGHALGFYSQIDIIDLFVASGFPGGVFLGIMDPTLAPGVREELTSADLRTFGLMGWDLVPDAVGVPDQEAGSFTVLHAAPNPLRTTTTFRFSLDSPGAVRVDVFDVRGRRVATPVTASFDLGDHVVRWNGRDHRGRTLPGGVYYARLVSAAGEAVVKLVKLD